MKTTLEELKIKFEQFKSEFKDLPEFSTLSVNERVKHQQRKIMYIQSIGSGCFTMQQKHGDGTMTGSSNPIPFSFKNSSMIVVGVCVKNTNAFEPEVKEFSNKLLFDCIMNDMKPFMQWNRQFGFGGDNNDYSEVIILFEKL